MTLTRKELLHGRALLAGTFVGPWSYAEHHIDCGVCQGGTTSVCDGKEFVSCTNPECDGQHAPATFVEAPNEYPNGQVTATIDVPGFSDLAEKNGQCICWLRNNAADLIDRALLLLDLKEALEFIGEHDTGVAVEFGNDVGVLYAARHGQIIQHAERLGWRKGSPQT